MELLDDFYHVRSACNILAEFPYDRPLINWLHCMGGQSTTVSKIMSLLVITAAMALLYRFLVKRMPRGTVSDLPFFLLQPMVLFPYFYASQFSTAITNAWAVIGAIFFLSPRPSLLPSLLGSCVLAIAGVSLRFESVYIITMMSASLLLLAQNIDDLDFYGTVKKYFGKNNSIKIAVFYLVFFAAKGIILSATSTEDALGKAIESGRNSYPIDAWYNSQVVAILRYLQNFFLPFSHSFYGDWHEWLWVDESFEGFLPAAAFVSLTIGALSWSLASRGLSGRARLGIQGIALFIFICSVSSSVPRSDWYYPSRQHLASIVLMGYMLVLFRRLRSRMPWAALSAAYFAASLIYASFFQYKNMKNMYDHDMFFYGDVHPFVRFHLAEEELAKGGDEIALGTYFNVYDRIPWDAAMRSHRAAVFVLQALYNGYYILKKNQRHEQASEIFSTLIDSTYFISTAACLQSADIGIDRCLDSKEKKDNFCVYHVGMNFPRLRQFAPYRIDVDSLCHHGRIVPIQTRLDNRQES